MQKRHLGQTGIVVSVLGLGTVKWGRNQGLKYAQGFALPTDSELAHLLSLAADLGINLLDTAPAYGSSEERLGKLIGDRRHDFVISSKAGEEFHQGKSHYDFSPSAICQSVERSLRRLQTDYVDVLLVHSNGDDITLIQEDQVFTVLAKLKEEGKIRAYGMSTKTLAGGTLAVELADVAMVTYNPLCFLEREVILRAKRLNKGILIKKAHASGQLHASVRENMQFIFQEPGVSSVIVGTIDPAHLQENVEAVLMACPTPCGDGL